MNRKWSKILSFAYLILVFMAVVLGAVGKFGPSVQPVACILLTVTAMMLTGLAVAEILS